MCKNVENKLGINQRLNLDSQHYAFTTCRTVETEDKDGPYQGFDLDLET